MTFPRYGKQHVPVTTNQLGFLENVWEWLGIVVKKNIWKIVETWKLLGNTHHLYNLEVLCGIFFRATITWNKKSFCVTKSWLQDMQLMNWCWGSLVMVYKPSGAENSRYLRIVVPIVPKIWDGPNESFSFGCWESHPQKKKTNRRHGWTDFRWRRWALCQVAEGFFFGWMVDP